jgi:hypothetical protein
MAESADNGWMRRSVWVVVAVGLTVLAAACSSPSYSYVRNTSVKAAFKVPSDWRTFSQNEVLGITGPQPDVPNPIKWLVGIDGDPEASVAHVLDPASLSSDHPEGIALVQDLSFTEHDGASLGYLRNFLFPVDQLLQNASNAQVVAYDDGLVKDGFRGIHIEFQFRASALGDTSSGDAGTATDPTDLQKALLGGQGVAVLTPDFVQVNQTAYLDSATNRVYFIAVLCSAACYDRDRADIQSTVDSWTVLS